LFHLLRIEVVLFDYFACPSQNAYSCLQGGRIEPPSGHKGIDMLSTTGRPAIDLRAASQNWMANASHRVNQWLVES